jgi:hypothetical protein
MQWALVCTILPPALRLYAVEPVGVAKIKPSPIAWVIMLPSIYTFSWTV